MRNGISSFYVASLLASATSALKVPFRRDAAHSTTTTFSAFDPFNFGLVNPTSDLAAIYVGTIIVDGRPYEVQLDTGSSDLWLDTTGVTFSSSVSNTSILSSVTYGDTTVAAGPILIGEVTIGDFTVQKQAFMSAPGTNATTSNDKGLLGLGPIAISSIHDSLKNTSFNGNPLLDNIFSLYPDEPNFISFQLARSELGSTDGGTFTISEVPFEFTAISSEPMLEVLESFGYWTVVQDGMIINGETVTGHSTIIESLSNKKTITAIDTGNPAILAPQAYVDAVYAKVPGANFSDDAYVVPCDTKLNVSLIFGGQEYYLDPLDLFVFNWDDDFNVICYGAILPNQQNIGVDWLIGDTFMRNAYTKFDFGNWTDVGDTAPFVQFLSTTDREAAWDQFEVLNNRRWDQFKQHVAELKSNASDGSTTTVVSATSTPSSVAHSATSAPSSSVSVSATNQVTSTRVGAANSATRSAASSATAQVLSENLAADVSTDTTVDLSGLQRNSYIIIGLLGGAIVLLLVICALLLRRPKGIAYAPVSDPAHVPAVSSKVDYSYQTPYNDN